MYGVKSTSYQLLRRINRAAARLAACVLLLALLIPANSRAASTNVNVNVCYPPSSPTISSPADGTKTKESSVVMTGTATPESFVYAVRNGAEVGFVTASADGSYSISVGLIEGNNTLLAREKNVCGDAADAAAGVSVRRQNAPQPDPPAAAPQPSQPTFPVSEPDLGTPGQEVPVPAQPEEPVTVPQAQAGRVIITEPKQGAKFLKPTIVVEGTATPFTVVRLLLNGRQTAAVQTDEDGAFLFSLDLSPGKNSLIAVVSVGASQVRSETVEVYYETGGLLRSLSRISGLQIMTVLGATVLLSLVFIAVRRRLSVRRPIVMKHIT